MAKAKTKSTPVQLAERLLEAVAGPDGEAVTKLTEHELMRLCGIATDLQFFTMDELHNRGFRIAWALSAVDGPAATAEPPKE